MPKKSKKHAKKAEEKSAKPERKGSKKKGKSRFSDVVKSREFIYGFVAVVVILLVAWRVATLTLPGGSQNQTCTGLSVQQGDSVKVNYTGTLQNGEVFDSGSIEFVEGSGDMIPGFDEAVNGMCGSGEKTVIIPPEKAYGARDPSKIISVPLIRTINKTLEISISDFNDTFGEAPVPGKTYELQGLEWPIKVLSVSWDNVTLEHMPTNGQVVNSAYGNETITIIGDKMEMNLTPQIGSRIMTAFGEVVISGVSGGNMQLDFNSRLAGQYLTFKIKVLNITRVNPLDRICSTLNVPKTDKPAMEVFVMSYCPYGLQMEKSAITVKKLFGDKADIKIMFVNYIMHGKQEIDENTRDYCIQKEQPDKFWAYLECFVSNGQSDSCLTQAGVDKQKMDSCVATADQQFSISYYFGNTSTWAGGRYPPYLVNNDENVLYGVQGSPSVVINGEQADIWPRSPENVKNYLCCAFNNPPAECQQNLSDTNPSTGFGWSESLNQGTGGSCG